MFAKVFASLWQGSMVGRCDMQLVFIYMLANCDARGVFDQTPEVVSALTGIPLERVESAIKQLEAPDPRSRTATDDGRRITLLDEHRDWGWRIVNYGEYRNTRDEEARREQTREATRRWRDKSNPSTVNEDDSMSMLTVSNVSHGEPSVSHGEPMVSHGEPKQKQKQKQKQIESEPAGSTLFAELEAVVSTSPQPAMAHRLVKYLRDTGTTHHGCILAVLHHWHANLHKIDKPLAYYDRNGPARSAIIMQHNMAIAEQRQERLKRLRA